MPHPTRQKGRKSSTSCSPLRTPPSRRCASASRRSSAGRKRPATSARAATTGWSAHMPRARISSPRGISCGWPSCCPVDHPPWRGHDARRARSMPAHHETLRQTCGSRQKRREGREAETGLIAKTTAKREHRFKSEDFQRTVWFVLTESASLNRNSHQTKCGSCSGRINHSQNIAKS